MANNLKEIRKLSADKLNSRLADCYESMTNMRFLKALGDLEYPQKIRSVKKEIAQIKTILKENSLNVKENGN